MDKDTPISLISDLHTRHSKMYFQVELDHTLYYFHWPKIPLFPVFKKKSLISARSNIQKPPTCPAHWAVPKVYR